MDNSYSNQVPLPIDQVLPTLRHVLQRGHAVLSAPPGSGKTTRVPLALLQESWLSCNRIVILEPRRPAARMAARYMAAMLGESVGGTVGYQVRFDKKLSRQTRIEVVTEGILTRRLQSDPELSGVGLVVFDEFHERNLQADLGLALCLDIARSLREDLRLLVMSATLETAPIAALLPATLVEAQGRQYPITVHYLDAARVNSDISKHIRTQVERAWRERDGDILVFLPGRKEIETAMAELRPMVPDCELLPLYGGLSTQAQDAVLKPAEGAPRRIILSTDLAESSVTIPRIGVVVDSGLARKPRFDPNTGLTRLEIRRIARDSATQRAGRAGRIGPGSCYRCWTEADDTRLAATTPAELLDADLSGLVLELTQWGVADRQALSWLDLPPKGAWAQAVALLKDLGALGSSGRITPLGRRMAALPLHPRLAHMLVAAAEARQGGLAADLAAIVSERDPLNKQGDGGVEKYRDIGIRLDALHHWREHRVCPAGFSPAAIRHLERVAARLRRLLPHSNADGDRYSAGGLLSLAFPDRIAQRRPRANGRFLMASGREVRLPEDDSLVSSDYIVVVSLDAGSRQGWAWLAVDCARDELIEVHAARLEKRRHQFWDTARGAVSARREVKLGALVLISEAVPVEDSDTAHGLVLQAIRANNLSCLRWSERAEQFRARVETLRQADDGAAWPNFTDAALLADLEGWLAPWLVGVTSFESVRRIDLHRVLVASLDWQQRQRLEELAPEFYTTPAGSRRRISYAVDQPPVLAVALQEMFGTVRGPSVVSGKLDVVLHLLSPAKRPLQITQDLEHFWLNGYGEVRKEMRGRYPKHNWPDDPVAEKPHCGVKR